MSTPPPPKTTWTVWWQDAQDAKQFLRPGETQGEFFHRWITALKEAKDRGEL